MRLNNRMMTGAKSGIYLITTSSGMAKIGVSLDPKSRLKTFQTGSSVPLKLFKYLEVQDYKTAFHTERLVHKKLSAFRKYGEWFDVDLETAWKCVKNTAKQVNQYIVQKMGRSWFVYHESGNQVAGPFITKAGARDWIDRLIMNQPTSSS